MEGCEGQNGCIFLHILEEWVGAWGWGGKTNAMCKFYEADLLPELSK